MDVYVYNYYHVYYHYLVFILDYAIAAAVVVFFVALVTLVWLAILIVFGVVDACIGLSKLALRVPPAVTRLTVYRWLHIPVRMHRATVPTRNYVSADRGLLMISLDSSTGFE